MPLLQPNVREHNWQRLTRVFDAYGSAEFLTQFLFEKPYEGEREAVLLNFKVRKNWWSTSTSLSCDVNFKYDFNATGARGREVWRWWQWS